MRKFLKGFLLFLVLSLFAVPVYADMGLAMEFITIPHMLIGLIIIALIEAFVLLRKLKISFKRCFKISIVMNLVSSIIGILLRWIIILFIYILTKGSSGYALQSTLEEFFSLTLRAPWLVSFSPEILSYKPDLNWIVPLCELFLLVPFFFATWFVEYQVARRMLKQVDIHKINNAVFTANVVSYLLLFVWAVLRLTLGIIKFRFFTDSFPLY